MRSACSRGTAATAVVGVVGTRSSTCRVHASAYRQLPAVYVCSWSLLAHRGAVAALQADGHKLVSGALDGTVRVWEVSDTSGHPLYAISGHTAYMGSVQFEAGRLICDGTNNAVLLHDFLSLNGDAEEVPGGG